MKHGDQGKGKTAKAVPEASGKSSKAVAGKSVKAGGKETGAAARKGSVAVEKAGAKKDAAAGKGSKARPADEPAGFNNPVIASAFERAVEKYPNAFRKLTD